MLRLPPRLAITATLLAAASVVPLPAQDTRTVTEPTFPAVCTKLSAALTISGGEPSSETTFDTSRVQSALTACAGSGKAVELAASGTSNAFLLQPITIASNTTLIVDGGVTVFASRNPADYQVGTPSGSQDTCGTVGPNGNGCTALIATSPTTSTNIAIMGYGVINGRGGDKLLVSGVASTQSWWDVAAAKGSESQNNPVLIAANKSSNFVLYKISLINAPTFHVTEKNSTGFTAWGVKIATPWSAFNTDGLQTGQISNVTATNCYISDGDDDFVTTATSGNPSSNLTFENSYVGSGHGASISADGGNVSNFFVSNVNFSGASADGNEEAIHLKNDQSEAGTYNNVTYQNMCIENEQHPLRIDPFYSSAAGSGFPLMTNITVQNVTVLTAGQVGLQGYDANHITTLTLNNVVFEATPTITPAPQDITITLGPGEVYPMSLQTITGSGVSYAGSAPVTKTSAYSCTNAFPTIQGELFATTSASTVGAPYTAAVTNPATFTLNAVVEPLYPESSYGASTAAAVPTAAVNFYEGTTLVGSGTLGANGTLASASISNASVGTHTYTAKYAGDTNYAAFTFGSVAVTVSAGSAAQLAYTAAPPATLQYGNAPGSVTVAVEDGAGDITASTASVSLAVSGPSSYSQTYTANAVNGTATFNLSSSLPGIGGYTYAATSNGLTGTGSDSETVTTATLQVAAQTATRIFGAPNPAFTYGISGYVNSDPSSVVNGAPALTTTALRNSNATTYPINIAAGTLAAANYAFNLTGSTLTITGGAAQAILFAPLPNLVSGHTYQLAARTTSGLSVTYTVSGNASVLGSTLTVTAPGPVTVTANSSGNGNYAAASSQSQSFTAQ